MTPIEDINDEFIKECYAEFNGLIERNEFPSMRLKNSGSGEHNIDGIEAFFMESID